MITRREFNSQLAQFLLALTASTFLPLKKLYAAGVLKFKKADVGTIFLIGIGPKQKFLNGAEDALLVPIPSKIFAWDLEQKQTILDLPYMPHSFAQHPLQPHIISFGGRYFTENIVYNLNENKIISVAKAAPNSRFFGHSCFSNDGTMLYISENNDEKGFSVLTGWHYDTPQAKRMLEIKTGGKRIHDCQMALDKNHIMTSSSQKSDDGSLANFSWIDLKTHKVTKQIPFKDIGPVHFHQLTNGYIAVGGGSSFKKDRPSSKSMIGIISPSGEYTAAKVPEKFMKFYIGESLNLVSAPKQNLVFVALPTSNSVFVVNYQTAEVIERLEFLGVTGITVTPDENHFVVTEISPKPRLSWVNTKTLKVEKSQNIEGLDGEPPQFWSSHIVQINKLKLSA